jgi:hypothetical protein
LHKLFSNSNTKTSTSYFCKGRNNNFNLWTNFSYKFYCVAHILNYWCTNITLSLNVDLCNVVYGADNYDSGVYRNNY